MEIQNGVVELIDEKGEEVSFEHLMTLEHEDDYYIVLVPVDEDEDDIDEENEDEVVILKMEKDEQGEDCYVTIEDEKLLEVLFQKFVAAIEEEYAQEEEDEEEDLQEPFLN